MELDEYKLKTYQRFTGSFPGKSLPDLKAMMHNRVNPIVQKIQKSLQLEIVFALVFVIFIFSVILRHPGNHVGILAYVTLGFCVACIFDLILLYRKINDYYSISFSVKESLERLILIIKKFTSLYFEMTMVFLPVMFLLAFVTVTADENYLLTSIPVQKILLYAGVALVWCVIMYFFTKWYVSGLYGKHLQNLKDQLNELQEVSED